MRKKDNIISYPYAEVALPLPVMQNFFYLVPPYLSEQVLPGMRLIVPVRDRLSTGYCIRRVKTFEGIESIDKIREIKDILDNEPMIDTRMLDFCKWISSYYLFPLGMVIKTIMPAGTYIDSFRVIRIVKDDDKIKESLPILYEELKKKGEIKLSLAIKRFKISRSKIFSLVKSGLIEVVTKLKKGIKPKDIFYIIFNDKKKDDDLSSLSPKQKEILLFIKEKREIESNLIARKFKSPYAQIKKLIEKEWIYKEKREIFTNSIKDPGLSYGKKITLTEPQKKALNKIEEALNLKIFSPFLLYGITGSGKTEVYLAAFEKVLKKGGKGLLLVPEIALTPQLLSRFKNRLNTEIALLHSGLSTRERFDQWMRIKRGEISMVIGARSALFAPFSSLDLIVVDEEHDTAYKQEEGVKYHARDMALVLGKMVNAVVLLGSATPSVESFYNCEIGKFNLLSLPERPGISSLPEIEIVDIRRTKNDSQFLSKKLIAALKENLKKREQSMLFLNRRGFAPFVLCRSCGEVPRCPNCSVSLTLHRDLKKLLCHYCGYSTDFSNLCPVCKKEELIPVGMGTEQIEKKLKDIFPEATIKRMDKDTVKKRNSLTNILKALREKEIDILIGTQMIIKGHDYPNVTLVGILLADLSLNFPDFRSGEKTFQLLTQAAGRAGRGEKKGKVVIQTFNPFNPIIRMATTQDYLSFYKEEIKFRKELNYPPYSRLALIKFSTNNKQILFEGFNIIKETAEKMVKESLNIEIIGPSFAPLSKLKGRHRGQILIKGKNSSTIHRFLKKFIKMIEKRVGKSIEIKIDVDPYNML